VAMRGAATRGRVRALADDAELVLAERALFAAIATRDHRRLAEMVATEFILRAPNAPDVHRAEFLAAMASLPGEILSVEGEGLQGCRVGPNAGLVSGIQVARVKVDGVAVEDRQAFVDLFVRRSKVWRLAWAQSVPAPRESR